MTSLLKSTAFSTKAIANEADDAFLVVEGDWLVTSESKELADGADVGLRVFPYPMKVILDVPFFVYP